jgi:thymidylate synthase (FAD)
MKVELIDNMGSDLSVVNAARVSFNKLHTEFDDDKDTKLIRYLARHNHWSPFGHAFISLRIRAPIFVARQLGKHQVGLCWNEVSRRYVNYEPEFYMPDSWRKKAENKKQGSSDEAIEYICSDYMDNCLIEYNSMLEADVCEEQARMVLPQNMMTEWIFSLDVLRTHRKKLET